MKTLLFNPFKKFQETQLLIIGGLVTLAGIFLANILNTRFDGAIDVHFVKSTDLKTVITDILVAVLSLLIFLFIAAKIGNKNTRFVDILTTTLVSRIPLLLYAFLNINNYMSSITEKMLEQQKVQPPVVDPATLIPVLLMGLVGLAFVVWFFALLWNGYKTASNAKGTKPVLLFIGAVLVAEIVSMFVLSKLPLWL